MTAVTLPISALPLALVNLLRLKPDTWSYRSAISAPVRIQEESTVRLDDIVLSSAGSSVDIRIVSGSVLNKVERLAGTDSTRSGPRPPLWVCGVPQFGVNVSADGDTRVAVREGRVAMVPPAADPDRLRRRAATAGDAAEAVEAAADALAERAPVIEANQELVLDRATAAEAEVAGAELESAIAEVEEQTASGTGCGCRGSRGSVKRRHGRNVYPNPGRYGIQTDGTE